MLLPLTDYLSLTGQVVVEGYSYQDQDDYEPDIDLLFLALQLTPEVRLRAGRLRTPFFMISEYAPVGYAYPWISPPLEVYNPITQSLLSRDGISASFFRQAFGGDLVVNTLLGSTNGSAFGNSFDSEVSGSIELVLTKGPFIVRYNFQASRAEQTVAGFDELITAYRAYDNRLPPSMGGAFADLADAHLLEDAWVRYQALGVRHELDNWRYDAEMNHISSAGKGFSPEVFGAFFSVSKYVHDLEYYAVLGHHRVRFNGAMARALNATFQLIPQGTDPLLDQLREISGAVVSTVPTEFETISLGIRWDVFDNIALKYNIRYTQGHKDPGAIARPADTVLNRLSLDMVF